MGVDTGRYRLALVDRFRVEVRWGLGSGAFWVSWDVGLRSAGGWALVSWVVEFSGGFLYL